MGTALKYLRELLEKFGLELDKRTATSLLILLLLLILLPVGLFLIRSDLNFFPRAAGELIQLGDGGCIKLNKDKKKVVDCPTVPLKLVNPFFNIRASSVPSTSTSTSSPTPIPTSQNNSPSPSPSSQASPTALSCASSANNGAELLAAVNCYKNAGIGGRITLPAGTIEVDKKISVPNDVTIAGAGINSTIIIMSANFSKKTTPQSGGDDALMANDSSKGQQNIVLRDFTLQGDGQRSGNSCCYGLKLQNISNSFVINVGSNNFGIDGIYMGTRPNKPGANRVRLTGCSINNNGRAGISFVDGSDSVIDHCQISGNSTNELVSGINLEPDNGNIVSNVHIFENNITNNRNNGIQITQNTNDVGGLVLNNFVCNNTFSGNGGTDFDDQGFGTSTSGCSDGNLNPPSAYRPSKNSFIAGLVNFVVKTAFAQDSDDIFTGASGTPSASSGSSPQPSASPGASGVLKYRLSETQAGLAQAQYKEFAFKPSQIDLALNWLQGLLSNVLPSAFAQDSDDNFTGTSGDDSDDIFTGASGNPTFSIGKQFITVNFQLTDTKPGPKQVWVQYLHPDGTTRVDHVTFDLVDKVPQITGLACNLDIAKQNLKITVDGNFFGTDIGKVTIVSPSGSPEVLGWNESQINALLKSPGIQINQGQRFQMKVVRPDGFESPVATCAVDKSLISLGARLFCREPGKFDASDVLVTLLYNSDETGSTSKISKVEEKVTINASGEIDKLKTQLQVGKSYVISIKAPNSLRRTATFTASEGTTQITRNDGTPFILPVGDIAPKINVDGQINTLDRSELIRQWRILGQVETKQTGDFNRDGRVNSIDWACMQYDFGSSDDPLPVEVPGSGSNTIHIPVSGSGTITIPKSSPTPRPSVSSGNSIFANISLA